MAKARRAKSTRRTSASRANSRSTTRTRKKKNNIDKNLVVVVMIITSLLLCVLIYAQSGWIGEHLSPVLGGIMGWIKYIIPIGTLAMAIKIAVDDKEYLSKKIVNYIIFLVCIAATMVIVEINKGVLSINLDFSTFLEDAYDLGTQNVAGGVIGAIIAMPVCKLIGTIGGIILLVGIALITLINLFEIKPAEIIRDFFERMKERREYEEDDEEDEDEEELDNQKSVLIEKKKDKAKNKKNKKEKAEEKEEKEEIPIEEQITINLNETEPKKKKLNHGKEESNTGTKENKSNQIEANLFKQEQEKKEEKTKEVLVLEHGLTEEEENYEFPPIELLSEGEGRVFKGGKKALTDTAAKLQKTLYSFGVSAKVENVSVGPAITRYEVKPAEGVRVNKIANLADDIALSLAAESIRIEAPIPGKQAVGIEIPNKENEVVHLRDIIETEEFVNHKSKLALALGKNVGGEAVIADVAKMPHVLIAGSTGSGKSVCINTLITSILYKAKPNEVKLLMVDPKVVELSVYNGIPHLLIPVVTDPKKAAGALAWAVQEMVNRYSLFANKGVRDIKGYNAAIEKEGGTGKLPQIVIIIDELADLMMVAAKDVEDAICRLAQMARAAGMHLVIATQRPSVDVITGIIKANIPSRIAFAVSSQVDSRTILDSVGAEKLLGKGDMLFYPSGASKPTRVQGSFVSDGEVEKIVDFLKFNGGEAKYNEDIIESIEKANSTEQELDRMEEEDDTDPLLMEAIDTVVETGQASTSFIQRRFKVGYARAGRIIDQMEERGIISGYQGSKPREVLITKERLDELKMGTTPDENT